MIQPGNREILSMVSALFGNILKIRIVLVAEYLLLVVALEDVLQMLGNLFYLKMKMKKKKKNP